MTLVEQARAVRAAMDRRKKALDAARELLRQLGKKPGLPELLQALERLRALLEA